MESQDPSLFFSNFFASAIHLVRFVSFLQKYSIENKFQIELGKNSVLHYHSKINAKSVSCQKTSLEFRAR